MKRFSTVLLVSLAMLGFTLVGCSSDDADSGDEGTETTAVPGEQTDGAGAGDATLAGYLQRSEEYVSSIATDTDPNRGSRDKVWREVARFVEDTDGTYVAELTVEDLDTITERFAEFADTTDFDMIALIHLWYRSDMGERLAPDTRDHLQALILDFKYWYTEPQPDGIIDERWYWSENHQALFHTIEYLAGQAFPDATFTNNGETGTQHMAHADKLLRRWLDERVRFGFSEWYSNVYYKEDLWATVGLVDFAEDEDLATLGAIVTDIALYDMASHTHQGAFGATHGRTYKKDKMTALDEDTWDVSKLVLNDTDLDYTSTNGALFLASSSKYQPPAVLEVIVADDGPAPSTDDVGGVVEMARHSLDIDPLALVTANPEGPLGMAFDDPENLMTWWGMAALTPWQTVVETTNTMTEYNLWAAELFSDFKPFEPLVKAAPPETVRELAGSLAPQLNIGLLSSANTYTWRTSGAMLSTVQDWRKGQASDQHHVWQATFSPDAQVFTTHPRTATDPEEEWHSNSEDWTGNASLPRSAQHLNVNVSMYAPLFASADVLQGSYQEYTHAYFPQDHFDEVVSEGNWTFGRLGTEYIALYSWRIPTWKTYDASVDTNGMTKPFEIVAEGGPNNVWITEVGSEAFHGTFDEFQAGISANAPTVTPLGDPAVFSTGFDVAWESPSQGPLTFGWNSPFTVDGDEQQLSDYPRIDSPWAKVPFNTTSYSIAAGGHRLEFDAATPKRTSE